MFLNAKNTQEVYDNMGNVSGNNAIKCIVVTKWVDEFNMDIFHMKDNPRLNSLNEPTHNRLMSNMKLWMQM